MERFVRFGAFLALDVSCRLEQCLHMLEAERSAIAPQINVGRGAHRSAGMQN